MRIVRQNTGEDTRQETGEWCDFSLLLSWPDGVNWLIVPPNTESKADSLELLLTPGEEEGRRREETLDTGHTIHSILSPVSIMTGMRLPHRYSTRQEDLVQIISEIKQHLKSIHAYQLAFLPF